MLCPIGHFLFPASGLCRAVSSLLHGPLVYIALVSAASRSVKQTTLYGLGVHVQFRGFASHSRGVKLVVWNLKEHRKNCKYCTHLVFTCVYSASCFLSDWGCCHPGPGLPLVRPLPADNNNSSRCQPVNNSSKPRFSWINCIFTEHLSEPHKICVNIHWKPLI